MIYIVFIAVALAFGDSTPPLKKLKQDEQIVFEFQEKYEICSAVDKDGNVFAWSCKSHVEEPK
jgi:hypothetical protein